MANADCKDCGKSIDLDTNLEDYNFETKLCIDCERKKEMNEGQELVGAPTTAIQPFVEFEAEIVEFEEMNSKMKFDLATEKGVEECESYLLLLRKVEIRIDKKRKAKGTDLRQAVTDLNASAKEWHNRVHVMYDVHDKPLAKIRQANLDAIIDAKEKADAEAKAIEDKRLADLEKREAAANAKEAELSQKQHAQDIEDARREAGEVAKRQAVRDIEDAAANAKRDKEAREANVKHRKDFNNAAALAIENITCDRGISVLVVTAIVKGEIPNVTMNY